MGVEPITANEKPWKRVVQLTLWLHLMLPVGAWKLYKDPALSNSNKWRVFIYLYALPWLIGVVVSIWSVSLAVKKYIP